MSRFLKKFRESCSDMNFIFWRELKLSVKDQGVFIFFIFVPLLYPLLYTFIYNNEVIREVPIAVVDDNRSTQSRQYLREVDASPDVKILSYCANMQEAKSLVRSRDAYGIVYVPREFSRNLMRNQQTYVSIFSDMSGLLYYKALLMANTAVSLKMNAEIKVKRNPSTLLEQDRVTQQPLAYEEINLFNPQTGFASFLIPAVLMLIIQQTLLLGVGMSAGTARESNRFRELVPVSRHNRGLLRVVFGKSLAYMLIYLPLSVYVLGVVPHLFHLNQIGNPGTLVLFVIPYLIACIFFAMAVSVIIRHRESCMLLIVFASVMLLFVSGISWPGTAIPPFWQKVGYLFPSTFGINGFVRINNMGADITDVRTEWFTLWYQACVYFLITLVVYRWQINTARRRHVAAYLERKRKAIHKFIDASQQTEEVAES